MPLPFLACGCYPSLHSLITYPGQPVHVHATQPPARWVGRLPGHTGDRPWLADSTMVVKQHAWYQPTTARIQGIMEHQWPKEKPSSGSVEWKGQSTFSWGLTSSEAQNWKYQKKCAVYNVIKGSWWIFCYIIMTWPSHLTSLSLIISGSDKWGKEIWESRRRACPGRTCTWVWRSVWTGKRLSWFSFYLMHSVT